MLLHLNRMRSFLALLVLGFWVFLLDGYIGDRWVEVDSKQTSSSSSSSPSSSSASGIPSLETEYAVVDPLLKRLSHFEYNNGVADVLKADLQPADDFSWPSSNLHRLWSYC